MITQNSKHLLQKHLQNLEQTLKTLTNTETHTLSPQPNLSKYFKIFIVKLQYYLKHFNSDSTTLILDPQIKESIHSCLDLLNLCRKNEKYVYSWTLFRFIFRKFQLALQEQNLEQINQLEHFLLHFYPSQYKLKINLQFTEEQTKYFLQKISNQTNFFSFIPQNLLPTKKFHIKILANLEEGTLIPKLRNQLEPYILCACNTEILTNSIKLMIRSQNISTKLSSLYEGQVYRCVEEIFDEMMPKFRYTLDEDKENRWIVVKFQSRNQGKQRYIYGRGQRVAIFYYLDLLQRPRVVEVRELYGMLGKKFKSQRQYNKSAGDKKYLPVAGTTVIIELIIFQQQPILHKKSVKKQPPPQKCKQQQYTSCQLVPPIRTPLQSYKYVNNTLLLATKSKYITKYTKILMKNEEKYSIWQPAQCAVHCSREIWILSHESSLISIKILLKLCEQQREIKPGSITPLPITKTLKITPSPNTHHLLNKLYKILSQYYTPSSYTIIHTPIHEPSSSTNPNSIHPSPIIITYINYNQCVYSYVYLTVGGAGKVEFIDYQQNREQTWGEGMMGVKMAGWDVDGSEGRVDDGDGRGRR